MRPAARGALAASLAALTVTAVAYGSVRGRGLRAAADAERAVEQGDTRVAIERAADAVRARAPLCDAHARGGRVLSRIATRADEAGDVPTMSAAWLELHAAADATDDRALADEARRGIERTAARIAATPELAAASGCGAQGDTSCVRAVAKDLASATHPSPGSHAWLLAVSFAALVAAIAATRTRR